ncbi:MAG: hypothetical protein ACXV7J_03850 [Methylomonas sp.]
MALHRLSNKQRRAKEAESIHNTLSHDQNATWVNAYAEKVEKGQLNRRERRHFAKFTRSKTRAAKQ